MPNHTFGLLGMVAFVLTLGATKQAAAQEEMAGEAPTGLELGLRVAYGIPLGKATDDATLQLNDGISGQIPLWVDLGYRVTPELMIGAYFSYGFGFTGSELEDICDAIDGCTVRDLRLGAQLQYHVRPLQSVDPWLGVGVGYEWLTFTLSNDGTDASSTAKGFEFVSFQAGLDFPSGPSGGIGPFIALSLAQYDSVSTGCSGSCSGFNEDSDTIDDKAIHEWLFLGVRGTFVP